MTYTIEVYYVYTANLVVYVLVYVYLYTIYVLYYMLS